jgi:hypothetical protein
MREILPGVRHWTARHPAIGMRVSSYALVDERVLLDPLVPEEGVAALAEPEPPADVLLTNRHHWRGCSDLREAFGVTVHAPRAGLHEFGEDRPVVAYDPGDTLPGGAEVHEVGHLCPDEMALWLPRHGALALADGVIRHPPDGPLCFVPDFLIGEDPEPVKAALRERYAALAEALAPEHLLLAHGDPVVGGATAALARFAREGGSASFG